MSFHEIPERNNQYTRRAWFRRGYGRDPAFIATIESVLERQALRSDVGVTILARRILATFCGEHPEYRYDDPAHPMYYHLPSTETVARQLRRQARLLPRRTDCSKRPELLRDSTVVPLRDHTADGGDSDMLNLTVVLDPLTHRVVTCRTSASEHPRRG